MVGFFFKLKMLVGCGVLIALGVSADVFNQQQLKTHLRWNLNVPKDQVNVQKKGLSLVVETRNLDLFQKISDEIQKTTGNTSYIETISSSREGFPEKPASISIKLKDQSVELFSFYRDVDKKYILDFWINNDLLGPKVVNLSKPLPLPVEQKKASKPVAAPKKVISLLHKENNAINPVIKVSDFPTVPSEKGLRDFRYGSSFIWDYSPMIPSLEKDVNLNSKIPDSLYPIKDRIQLDDKKEAHMQLTINFYKEEKFGLMNKSISLYEKKYGRDSNFILNEFIKANALLKGNLAKPNKGITQSAMIILSNVKDMTEDYELKSATLRYLVQYYLNSKDYIKTLDLSKQLFVEARTEFDHTTVINASLTILHCLAELKQTEKIDEFLSDKKLASILPTQMGFAYKSFSLLSKNLTKDVLTEFVKIEKSLAKPVHPAIIFNVAESFFRSARYEEALKYYQEFLTSYSYLLEAPQARVRLALSFELLDRPAKETLALYRTAIDRSTHPAARFEAKVRYVGMRIARNLNPSEEDIETEVFLEQSPDETKILSPELKKILWLTRLRILIATKDYDKALAYLTSIPLDTFKPTEKRVFEGDGAEIVFGIIKKAYLDEDYSKTVKLWEVYKDKYETKVARNIYLNYIVSDSFIKLGLFKSYDRALSGLKKIQTQEARTFPLWVERKNAANLDQMVEELAVIRLVADKDWKAASDKLASFSVSQRDSLNYSFYKGYVDFQLKNYTEAIKEFEKVLVKQKPGDDLTPRQMGELLIGYVESLYQLKDQNRFKTVVKALSKDIGLSKSASILNVSERVNYLLIEAYAGEANPEWKELETMTKKFRTKFQKSPYSARIEYLYGLSLIKNSQIAEGKAILNSLSNEKDVPMHIKEMCRSELATLELVNKL